jgi:hypothetical protein
MNRELSEEEQSNLAARHRLESELVILQSDARKLRRQAEDMTAEVRQLKGELKRMEIFIQTREVANHKIDAEITLNDVEVARLKKRLNLL